MPRPGGRRPPRPPSMFPNDVFANIFGGGDPFDNDFFRQPFPHHLFDSDFFRQPFPEHLFDSDFFRQPFPNFPNRPERDLFHDFFHGAPEAETPAPEPAPLRRPQAVLPPCRQLQDNGHGDCVVCLEALKANQASLRLPCRHMFHESCVKPWLKEHSSCPTCKLDLVKPNRKLLYQLKELEGLSAAELKYTANYLGVKVERGSERATLELEILKNPNVLLSCTRQELQTLPVKHLRSLLQCANVKMAGLSEKKDLVEALLGSSRCSQPQSPESPPLEQPRAAGFRRAAGQSHRSAPY